MTTFAPPTDFTVTANGRAYRVPTRPVVVITVDGGDPEYFRDALRRRLMPNLRAILGIDVGTGDCDFHLGASEMPSLTNPNNISIVTGVSPAIHGIPGNYCRLNDGRLELLNRPEFLRAPSIHAAFQAASVPTLMVTAKDKLRLLLGNGGVPSVSVEKASGAALPEYGIQDLEALVGEPAPGIYDPSASQYAMRLALAVCRANPQIGLVYVSLTDFVQHSAAPGDEMADAFLVGFDELLGEFVAEDFTIGITADHGMSSKHAPDGTPRVHYLGDILRDAAVPVEEIVLPITDPYTRHHGALGSFAWVYVADEHRAAARDVLRRQDGIEEVWDREDAATIFEHPADRIGDLAVTAAADTALGGFVSEHDLSGLHGALRSHGGRHEQLVPLITNRPVVGPLADRYHANTLRSRDLHDLVLNNVLVPDLEIRS